MNEIVKKIIAESIAIVIIIASFMVLSLYGFTMLHEEVHKVNCEMHGGKAKVYIFDLGLNGGKTYCMNDSFNNLTERQKLDILNEIVGYHFLAIWFAMFCCIFIIISILLLLRWIDA